MKTRTLGKSSLEVSALGLGCMGMSWSYHPIPDRKEMIALLRQAVERGVTFFDTAEVYGPLANEELVGEALAPFCGRGARYPEQLERMSNRQEVDPWPPGRRTSCGGSLRLTTCTSHLSGKTGRRTARRRGSTGRSTAAARISAR